LDPDTVRLLYPEPERVNSVKLGEKKTRRWFSHDKKFIQGKQIRSKVFGTGTGIIFFLNVTWLV
jgi:hypothetical protein